MMNKRGQALVEFILILPVLLLIIFGFIDMSMIMYNRIRLERINDEVIKMYENNENEIAIKKYIEDELSGTTLIINNETDFTEFILNKDIDTVTPGFDLIFESPYPLAVSRKIYVS